MKSFLLILMFFFPVTDAVAEETVHPIDLKLGKCLEENNYTAGMSQCFVESYNDWDKELNIIYRKLAGKLESEERKRLLSAQLEWLKYRDLEFKLIDSLYNKKAGTMYIPMRMSDKVNLVRKRTLNLSSYLDLLEY